MSEPSHRPLVWSTLEEYEGAPDVLARQGGGDWNTKPAGFAEEPAGGELKLRRRTFLKMSGFAAVLAAVTACEKPLQNVLPYVKQPEEMIPGVPNYYASTCGGCAAGCGLLVKTREGRPIKLEGNPNHPVNRGALCARGQASLLELYDPDRLRAPITIASNSALSWDSADARIAEALRAAGNRAVLLTGTLHGPARRAAVAKLREAFPGLRHIQADAIGEDERIAAWELVHGRRELPRYQFDKSEVTVLLGADPIAEGPSPVEFNRGIGQARRLRKNDDGSWTMGKLYAFEPLATNTGMNADHRLAVRPSDLPAIALALAGEVSRRTSSPVRGLEIPAVDASSVERRAGLAAGTIENVATDLVAARGRSLVYAGNLMPRTENAMALHVAVTLTNLMLENEGATVLTDRPSNQAVAGNGAMLNLVEQMRNGEIDVLLVDGTNPAHFLPASVDFAGAMARVGMKVSFATHLNETAKLCDLALPGVHFLENWGDAEAIAGVFTLTQPTIGKLWDNRAFEESLLMIARAGGAEGLDVAESEEVTRAITWHEFLRETWRTSVYDADNFAAGFDDFWFESLRRGVVERLVARDARGFVPNANVLRELLSGATTAASPATLELVTHVSPNLGDGRHANNPWLLELPDPVSRVAWDNFVAIAPATARGLNLTDGDIVTVTVGDASVEGPVRRHPGMHKGVVAVSTGWGRTAAGAVGNGEGFNAYALGMVTAGALAHVGRQVLASGGAVTLAKTGRSTRLADVQGHNFLKRDPLNASEPVREILQSTSLPLFNESEKAAQQYYHIPYWTLGDPKPDLWKTGDFPYVKHKWAMAIDLNSCTGCNACMIACQAENNVPVVGKREVLVGREMHWIRIDRYYKGDVDNPEIIKMPMLCQHCDNAPCETVCPVLATVHSDEGINQQVYNRCVGTRYCANNCPYKVRRFNFYEYSRFRKGPHDELEAGAEHRLARTPLQLMLNPDITVRSKGIMEKCTFCQQRIRDAKYDARRAGQNIPNGALQTACQQTCPTQAITFGDALNPEHDIVRIREENADKRGFGVLAEFNVKPNVMYLAHVWNRETREWDTDYHHHKPLKKDGDASHDADHSHSAAPSAPVQGGRS